MNKEKRIYLECECSTKDHIVVIHLWYWDDDPQLSISTQIKTYPEGSFWQRLKSSFWYTFYPKKQNCNFGGWTETLVKLEDTEELKEIINEFKSKKLALEEKWKSKK